MGVFNNFLPEEVETLRKYSRENPEERFILKRVGGATLIIGSNNIYNLTLLHDLTFDSLISGISYEVSKLLMIYDAKSN